MTAVIENNRVIGYSEQGPSWDGYKGRLSLWDLTTNSKNALFLGIGKAAKAAAHRHLRKQGFVYYLALCAYELEGDLQYYTKWGLCRKADLPTQDVQELVTGYTINHCYHRLGGGCADKGAKIYWSWSW